MCFAEVIIVKQSVKMCRYGIIRPCGCISIQSVMESFQKLTKALHYRLDRYAATRPNDSIMTYFN